MTDTLTAVYRLYDNSGQALYVGMSSKVWSRLREHGMASYELEIARVEIDRFRTRAEARTAEARAIRDERPLFNVLDNPEQGRRRPAPHGVSSMRAARQLRRAEKAIQDAVANRDSLVAAYRSMSVPVRDLAATLGVCERTVLGMEARGKAGRLPEEET
jgi:predicted GIY-YIG superfamily endonuclease